MLLPTRAEESSIGGVRVPEGLTQEYVLCPNRVKLSHFVQIVVACGLSTKLRAGGVSAALVFAGSGVRPRAPRRAGARPRRAPRARS